MNLSSKTIRCLALFLISFNHLYSQSKPLDLLSPNGEIKVSITISDKIYYSLSGNGTELLVNDHLMLNLAKETLGQNPKLITTKKAKNSEVIKPYISLKYAVVQNDYNSLLLLFKGNYSIEFRAFNDGIAYRFTTNKPGEIAVMNEDFVLHLPADYLLHLQQPNGFKTGYEEPYTHISSSTWKPEDKISTLPVLIDTKKGYKILISESDLQDYPCMFLKGTGNNGIQAVFPKVPLEFGDDGYSYDNSSS